MSLVATKRCTKCGEEKPLDEFSRDRRASTGRLSACKQCQSQYNAAYHAANAERKAAQWAAYYAAHREQVARYQAAYYTENRDEAIRVYGGRCEQCSSTDRLEFDHPNGDGKAHRKVESIRRMYERIARSGVRITDWDLRLLCFDCHKSFTAEQRRGRRLETAQ